MHYLKDLLAKRKCGKALPNNHLEAFSQSEVIAQVVPKYSELSLSKMWTHVKTDPDLMAYFPDYLESQLPDRDYMFSIISTVYPKTLKEIISKARYNRAIVNEADDDELIEIDPSIKSLIMNVLEHKSNIHRV